SGAHALAMTKADKVGHPITSAECDTCHTPVKYTDWTGAGFNHAGVTSGCSDSGCHNDADSHSRKRPTDHVGGSSQSDMTTANCQNCHGYMSGNWMGNCTDTDNYDCMDHTDTTVASKTCVTCHTSSKSPTYVQRYKNPTTTIHPNTSNNCQYCHNKNSSSTGAAGWKNNCPSDSDGNADCMDHAQASTNSSTPALPLNDACVDCHYSGQTWSADIITGTLCSGGLGDCSDTGTHPRVSIVSGSDACGDCHTSRTNWGSYYTPFKHAKVIGSGTVALCHNCHYNNSHSNGWSNRNWDTPEGHITVNDGTHCHSCHNSSDAGTGVATWRQNCVDGGTVNGYDAKDTDRTCADHAQVNTAASACQNCHLSPTDHRWETVFTDFGTDYRLTSTNFTNYRASPGHPGSKSGGCPNKCGTCHNISQNYWNFASGDCP
ncbi:MAG: hypothetical protein H0W44_05790, partial [Gammaproteobacteria bacterium]|nr:hypothetical protein [Gammaproteobacteria bacterium]